MTQERRERDKSTPGREGGRDDGPVLPSVTGDERDAGWGDEPGERSDEWYRRERPPHHE
ncbi:hypothetical protein [uncultured Jatrophihabitans sp.]|uniref:hypothetical protein n=1 Tax=uncultured Jatrophihabitans sp. TaxID=1610747 RepID=UPI0035CB264B